MVCLDPDLVLLATTMPGFLLEDADRLRGLARRRRCAIAGSAASPALAVAIGAGQLPGDPVSAAFEAAAHSARVEPKSRAGGQMARKRPAMITPRR